MCVWKYEEKNQTTKTTENLLSNTGNKKLGVEVKRSF